MAARPRTLPVAVAPVLVGSALAASENHFDAVAFVMTLIGAVFIQIGTNLANDYSDARRGADPEERLGPVRVVSAGLVAPKRILHATWIAFGIAVAAGIYLIAIAGWELLAIGAASILAGILYTGGPRPYGYAGMGELFVFLFFGLVAVTGSYFVQTERLDATAFLLAVPPGLLAASVLSINNIRDIETDRRAGKNTLAVKLGRGRALGLFGLMIYVPFLWIVGLAAGLGKPALLLALLPLPMAPRIARTVRLRTDGAALNRALGESADLAAVFGTLVAVGLLLS